MATRLQARTALRAEVAWGAAATVVTMILAAVALKLWNAEWHVPWSYSGDANLNQMVVKGVLEHGWYEHNPDLAAPFGQVLYDFPVVSGDNLQIFLMKVIGIFTSDSALVMNLFFLLTFPLTVACAYVASRLLGLSRPASGFVSILYALLPYHFIRGEFHLFIGAYFAVPLAACLVLATLRDRVIGIGLTVGFAVVIGSAHVYYAAFALILLAFAALVQLVAGNRRAAAGGAAAAALIALVVAANHLPNAIYRADHGTNHALERSAGESESYGLKLVEMVLPVEDHRVGALARLRERYVRGSGSQLDEGRPQAIGLVATAGVVGLLLMGLLALTTRVRVRGPSLPLAGATLAAILLGTVGGGSALIAYLLTAQLRAWGRISVLIAFFGLLAVALGLDQLRARFGPPLAMAAIAAVLVVGFLDQTNASSAPRYSDLATTYRSEQAFVDGIQARLPAGSMVFELPYEPFPEPQPAWVPPGFGPYDMARPYLHSTRLRWSYGLMKGRRGDWQDALVQLPPAMLARAIASVGFKGIYTDRAGYADDAGYVLTQLGNETGARVTGSTDPTGRLAFLDLRAYAARVRREHSPADVARLRAAVLRPLTVSYDAGFSALRQSAGARFRLTEQKAAVTFHNPYRSPRRATFAATLAPAYARDAAAVVRLPGAASRRLTIPVRGVEMTRRVTLPPGDSRLEIEVNGAPQFAFPDVTRPYYLRVENPVLMDSAFQPFGRLPRDRRAAAFLSPFGPI